MVKKLLLIFVQILLSASLYAQKDVTQFMGIPVDGYKPEMIKKLKEKGFTVHSSEKDVLVGEFNGTNVIVSVVTNNNKVYRIMVADVNSINEANIRIRFNNLCQQFKNNKNYVPASDYDYTIPEDENISYGMTVKNKRYQASFYQLPTGWDHSVLEEEAQNILFSKYTEEELTNSTEEEQNDMIMTVASHLQDKLSKKTIWFMISESYGKYYITMFYDNVYNQANGEDL